MQELIKIVAEGKKFGVGENSAESEVEAVVNRINKLYDDAGR